MAPTVQPARALRVADTADHLVSQGRAWFCLADTIWSAFTHVPEVEWPAYLRKRQAQGFNALLISVLPILHDMSEAADLPEPFAGFWSGRPQFGSLATPYLASAVAKLELARAHGFTPILADVWCNYAPATWASAARPEYVIPEEALDEYLVSCVEAFRPFAPVHMVSGDADFADPVSIAFYERALATVKRLAPESLTAMHLQPEATLPSSIADSADLDLYVYQSGHHLELQHLPYALAESYLSRPHRKPIVNLEPCYEGHGHGFLYGRFNASDVRRASWQSLLSGASAGLGYGSHGVWGWHQRQAAFNHADFSGAPFDRWTALEFAGAWDVSFLRHLVDDLGLHRLEPAQAHLIDAPVEVRAGTVSDGRLTVAYVPAAIELRLDLDDVLSVERWNLEARDVESVAFSRSPMTIPMSDWPGDSLLVIRHEDKH